MNLTRSFLIIAALALVIRVWVAFSETVPLWLDEMAHGNYVAYIYEHWSLPDSAVASEDLPAGPGRSLLISYEHYQPPGYYILAALFSGGSPHGARLVSVVMFMIALCFVWAASRDLAVTAALALIPGVIYATSVISNDVFLLLGSAVMFYACSTRKTWAFILGGVILATAKFHGIPILAAIGVYYFLKRQKQWSMMAAIFMLVGVAIAWWRWDLQKVNDQMISLITPKLSALGDIASQTIASGMMHIVPLELSQFSYMLGVVLGVILLMKTYRRITSGLPRLNLVIIGVVLLVWAVFSLTHEAWQGRLLYAAIPWLAVIKRKTSSPGPAAKHSPKTRRKPAGRKTQSAGKSD